MLVACSVGGGLGVGVAFAALGIYLYRRFHRRTAVFPPGEAHDASVGGEGSGATMTDVSTGEASALQGDAEKSTPRIVFAMSPTAVRDEVLNASTTDQDADSATKFLFQSNNSVDGV